MMFHCLAVSSVRGRVAGPLALIIAIVGLLGSAWLVSQGIFRFP